MSSTSCRASCLQVVALGAGEGPARPGEAAAKFSTSRYNVIFVITYLHSTSKRHEPGPGASRRDATRTDSSFRVVATSRLVAPTELDSIDSPPFQPWFDVSPRQGARHQTPHPRAAKQWHSPSRRRRRLRRSTRRSRGSGGRKELDSARRMTGWKDRPAGARCCGGPIDAYW